MPFGESSGACPEAPPAEALRVPTYASVGRLPLLIERCELLPLVRDTTSGFTKISTVVRLSGGSHVGEGEDITWDQVDQIELLRGGGDFHWLHGERTLDGFASLLGQVNLFPKPPIRASARLYRRWAFESAALDLALRQNGLSLKQAVGREARPVNFVASIRLGEPPSLRGLDGLLRENPGVRLKLDATPGWDERFVAELAALSRVDVVDFKGAYRNLSVATEPEPGLYRRVIEGLPDAWIEDPASTPHIDDLLERHQDRISWDEPIHSIADVERLPRRPRMLNVKPARFGSLRALLDTYDYCEARGVGVYGGGMFEQGPGRGQLQYLASLFHPDGPNDTAPPEYNLQATPHHLPRAPLAPDPAPTGFRWGTYDGRCSVRQSAGPATS